MENKFSKSSGLIVIVLIIAGVWYFSNHKGTNSEGESIITKPNFNNISETLGVSVINCQFKVLSNFISKNEDGKGDSIKYSTDNQSTPVDMVFSGLDTEKPVVKGNNGEDPLLVLSNTENEINLASSNTSGDMFLYKIYKNQKVATWYKSYSLLGNPYGLLSMGYCY